MRETILRGDEL